MILVSLLGTEDILIEAVHCVLHVKLKLSKFLLTQLISCLLCIKEVNPAFQSSCPLEGGR